LIAGIYYCYSLLSNKLNKLSIFTLFGIIFFPQSCWGNEMYSNNILTFAEENPTGTEEN